MAIKVSGNTVISDGRNVVAGTFDATNISANGASLSGIAPSTQIIPPTNISPVDGATDVSLTPTLEITNFEGLFVNTHANTQFQVSIDSGFSNTEVDIFTGANTTVVIPSTLSDGTEHFFRARFIDNNGCCSAFSTTTSFTTLLIPSTLGESICGGFYMGTINAAGSNYYLIMAPNATGCRTSQFKTSRTSSGVGCTGEALCDGYGNTYDHLTDADHRAGAWASQRDIAGFTDWYLPAICELFQLYTNCACAPAGEGFPETSGGGGNYWSSTESNASSAQNACYVSMHTGCLFNNNKDDTFRERAIRRVAFP